MDIDENNCRALLLSEKVLLRAHWSNFDEWGKHASSWSDCGIRSWLNGYDGSHNADNKNYTSDNFISAAFNSAEKNRILTTKIVTGKNPKFNTAGGPDVNDKLFLLSYEEVEKYFTSSDKSERKAMITTYGKDSENTIGEPDEYGNCHQYSAYCSGYNNWWLRTLGDNDEKAMMVQAKDGKYYLNDSMIGFATCNGTPGIRPAFWYDYSE